MKFSLRYLTLALVVTSAVVLADEDKETSELGEISGPTTQRPTTTSTTTTTTTTTAPKTKPNKSNSKSKDASIKGPDCPAECSCVEKKITCDDKKLTSIPNLSKFTNAVSISLRNNLINQLNFSSLPNAGSLENLDLYNNTIKTIVLTKKSDPMLKLKSLNLGLNLIENLTTSWTSLKLPSLEILDLSYNPIEELANQTFDNAKNIQQLRLDLTRLKFIHEYAFLPLTQLTCLNMSDVKITGHLGDKQFVANQKLDYLDLTNNSLVEVPFALRSTSSIKTLILNENLFTSLRQSDFINRTNLVTLEIRRSPTLTKIDEFAFSNLDNLRSLYITDNPKLQHVSKDAFKSDRKHQLDVFDLTGNNITSMSNPLEFPSVTFERIILSNNPWNCNCDSSWLQLMNQRSPPVHCRTPEQFRDMEISQYFLSIDCQADSSYHSVIVTGFLIFLFVLMAAVFVQRSEVCRRLLWKDQYGTIYYTKASFPPETV